MPKTPSKKTPSKKTASKKAPPKKTASKKAPPKKAPPKKTGPKKTPPKKAPKRAEPKSSASSNRAATGASREVSPVYGDEGERLRALRASDPQQSLVERWRLRQDDRNASELGYLPFLIEHGWAVTAVPEDRVIYTIGLHYRFGQRELLISSPDAASTDEIPALKRLLNELGDRVSKGARIEPGDAVEASGKTLTFQTFTDADFDRYPCGYLARFDELFDDTFHTRGGTLPVLWAVDEGDPKRESELSLVERRAKPTGGGAKKNRR